MTEKICCILDRDATYVVRIAEYINDKRILPYKVLAYTSPEVMLDSKEKYKIEFIIAEEFFEELIIRDFGEIEHVFLSEQESCGKENKVNRYQSVDQMMKEILTYIDGESMVFHEYNRKNNIICVYSPVGRSGKTSLSIGLARASAQKYKTLYINFEEFAGLKNILPENNKGLSEALYYFKIGGENAYGKIISCTGNIYGFDYFTPITCADDIGDLTIEDINGFLKLLVKGNIYEEIILDLGNIVAKPWEIFPLCDRILMPSGFDASANFKIKQLETYLLMTGKSEIMDRIEKISVDFEIKYFRDPIKPEGMLIKEMENTARRVLNARDL